MKRQLTENEVQNFLAGQDFTSYKLLKELMQEHLEAYDEKISAPVIGLDGIIAQQQAIGAKAALSLILTTHVDEIKNSEKKTTK